MSECRISFKPPRLDLSKQISRCPGVHLRDAIWIHGLQIEGRIFNRLGFRQLLARLSRLAVPSVIRCECLCGVCTVLLFRGTPFIFPRFGLALGCLSLGAMRSSIIQRLLQTRGEVDRPASVAVAAL